VADVNSSKAAVLVTRPAGEAAETFCSAVAAAGYPVYSQPLLELQPLSQLSSAQRKCLLELDLYQHVIFISGNAVRFGMAQTENYWPQLPVGLNWYAIGSATGALLKGFGLTPISPGSSMSSEGLLAISALQDIRDHRVLIVKGEGGRDTLGQELTRRGAIVDELACYRRCIPRMPAGALAQKMTRWQLSVVLISSGEGLANLQVLLSPQETTKFKHLCLIVPSARVASMALDAGYHQVVTAENASDAAMLCALEEWTSSSGE
jgi:uroporphyrinogen-III synthase